MHTAFTIREEALILVAAVGCRTGLAQRLRAASPPIHGPRRATTLSLFRERRGRFVVV